jgi:hypothetical protein
MDIKWNDRDPDSGERRFIRAERFGGFWKFHYRRARRGIWTRLHPPTIEMWEEVLDALERRLPRREGVTEVDVKQVRQIIAGLRARRGPDEEE